MWLEWGSAKTYLPTRLPHPELKREASALRGGRSPALSSPPLLRRITEIQAPWESSECQVPNFLKWRTGLYGKWGSSQ